MAGLWYCGFRHPHPPLQRLKRYWDLHRDIKIDGPVIGDWPRDRAALPFNARAVQTRGDRYNEKQIEMRRRAFYARTRIDHQVVYLVGTLRDEGILDDTVILFTSDLATCWAIAVCGRNRRFTSRPAASR